MATAKNNEKPINSALHAALFAARITQTQLARQSDVRRQYISLHINGKWILTAAEKARIAAVLKQPVEDFFPGGIHGS